MTISLELLQAERAALVQRRDELIASVNAHAGALNQVDKLIAVLQTKPAPDVEPPKPPAG